MEPHAVSAQAMERYVNRMMRRCVKDAPHVSVSVPDRTHDVYKHSTAAYAWAATLGTEIVVLRARYAGRARLLHSLQHELAHVIANLTMPREDDDHGRSWHAAMLFGLNVYPRSGVASPEESALVKKGENNASA
jgi:hypothetical protein